MSFSLVQSPLAIVATACRLPGADGVDAFWELLVHGRDAIVPFPESRLDRSLYYDPRKGVRGKTYTDIGGMIPERPLHTALLGMTSEEMAAWDPCHLIFAEVAATAWQQVPSLHRQEVSQRVGIYLGHSGGSRESGDLVYATLAEQVASILVEQSGLKAREADAKGAIARDLVERMRSGRAVRGRRGVPYVEASAAGRLVAKVLRLGGPQVVLDAACASSLVALGLASLAIQNGEVDAAIVGGASYNKCDSLVLFSNAQSCSATGTRPFDNAADGLISSEGYIAIILKRLDDALRDGDRIVGVLQGLGLASDGRGKSLWAPRREGQRTAVERAYGERVHGPAIDPKHVQFLEAHATSTQVGDATEVQALADFFGGHHLQRKLPIGSVKSNIGHTLETAGLAGMLKVLLAMQHETIPPTIHLETPNQSIPWDQLPFEVPTTKVPWYTPAPDRPRCAAVNAFGIGGLNVHVVLEQYHPSYHLPKKMLARPVGSSSSSAVGESSSPNSGREASKPSRGLEPIAIVGRGMILPGVRTPEQLERLVREGKSQLTLPDPSRWPGRIGVESEGLGAKSEVGFTPWKVSTCRGGYLTDYAYDWRTHKVPPKQVERANPLQFMLLDAAGQAIGEATAGGGELPSATTCVVVGTIFGGEFGHQLQLGLRLVELRRDIGATLHRFGVEGAEASQVLAGFEEQLLQSHPALLDETGSFTSSTLASRISKQFNLMGGALAIDAGDSSDMAALHNACSLLRQGSVDTVICACGQRAMDLPAYENQASQGWLSEAESQLPGEGVVVFVLKRLADARRDGNTVYGQIESLEVAYQGMGDGVSEADALVERVEAGFATGKISDEERRQVMLRHGKAEVASPATLPILGHLLGAQGATSLLARLTASTRSRHEVLWHQDRHGMLYRLRFITSPKPTLLDSRSSSAMDSKVSMQAIRTTLPTSFLKLCFDANDWSGLREVAKRADSSQSIPIASPWEWSSRQAMRAVVVGQNQAEIEAKLKFLAASETGAQRQNLARQGILTVDSAMLTRQAVAVLFPGQGSQHSQMLDGLIQTSPRVAAHLGQVEQWLGEVGSPTWGALLRAEMREGSWPVQASMLVANSCYWELLQEVGISPSVVAGHSLGEYGALLAAEAWNELDGLRLLVARARGVDEASRGETGLLSVQATQDQVRQFLVDYPSPIYLTHHNAPSQSVVGGPLKELDRFEEWLRVRGVTASMLSVPAAFHTPLMAMAQVVMADALRACPLKPARRLFMSSVNNRYLADPREIRRTLLDQLTSPVQYVDLVEHLYRDGARIFIECGPGQVLTRLHQTILQDRPSLCWSMDRSDHDAGRSLAELWALQQLLGLEAGSQAGRKETPIDGTGAGEASASETQVLFDATSRRRARRRHQASEYAPLANESHGAEKPVPESEGLPGRGLDAMAVEHQDRINRELAQVADEPMAETASTPSSPSLPTSATTPSTPVGQRDGLETFLRDFIVEHTGYPGEMIELDWDLEADLGIDSIKQAQLFGELREMFDFELKQVAQANVRTLRQLMVFLEVTGGKREWLADAKEASADLPVSEAKVDSEVQGSIAASSMEVERETMARFMIDFVVEHTGYPAEIVELQADFEADLGIDSIKLAQLFGELKSHFGMPTVVDHRQALAKCRSLQDILDLYREFPPASGVSPVDRGASESVPAVGALGSLTVPDVPLGLPEAALSLPEVSESVSEVQSLVHVSDALPEASLTFPEVPATLPENTVSSPVVPATAVEVPAAVVDVPASVIEVPASVVEVPASVVEVPASVPEVAVSLADETVREALPLLEEEAAVPLAVEEVGTGTRPEDLAVVAFETEVESQVRVEEPEFGDRDVQEVATAGDTEATRLRAEGEGVAGRLLGVSDWRAFGKRNASWIRVQLASMSDVWETNGMEGASQVMAPAEEELQALEGIAVGVGVHPWNIIGLRNRLGHPVSWSVGLNEQGYEPANDSGQIEAMVESESALSAVAVAERLLMEGGAEAKAMRAELAEESTEVMDEVRGNVLPVLSETAVDVTEPMAVELEATPDVSEDSPVPFVELPGTPVESPDKNNETPVLETDLANGSLVEDPLQRMEIWEGMTEESTHRYRLGVHASPVRSDALQQVRWQGAAAIYGSNPMADALEARLRVEQVRCFRLPEVESVEQLVAELDQCWSQAPVLHLFLASGFDVDAALPTGLGASEAVGAGIRRGKAGIRHPYWLCQRWLQRIIESNLVNDATLVGLTRLGGDLGFHSVPLAPEGGTIAGLLKAIMIECWVSGYRALPIKVVDSDPSMSSAETLEAVWHELANNSFDMETAWRGGVRHVVRAERAPLQANEVSKHGMARGDQWLCTGGGRGITAAVAERLAMQYGVGLHLIGKSALPPISDAWRNLDEAGLKQFKLEVMQQARAAGKNSLTAWQDMEKVLEIDATLRKFASLGIVAHYHHCDVSNRKELAALVARIRLEHGPIRGCLHGAGVGQDARFDRKRPEKVDQCFGAKWDGTLALMEATWDDPLEFFIGFGSISGRFGANGHTDYSSANDGLAKLIDWYRGARPEVKACAFHWHAWGDIGMATKPETKLALEMIDMTFMPANEGMKHFLRELEAGAPESEVLITDERYYRLFFPAETLVQEQVVKEEALPGEGQGLVPTLSPRCFAMLTSDGEQDELGNHRYVCGLDPVKEVFLREHCLQGRPLLPVVVGVEMLVEGAIRKLDLPTWREGLQGLKLSGLVALRGLRFFEDTPIEASVLAQQDFDGSVFTFLQADFHARNGMLVEKNRPYLQASLREWRGDRLHPWETVEDAMVAWKPVHYPSADQNFYVGPSFQVLKKVCLDGPRVLGRILAPILVELAGSHRKAEGWQVPSAVLDACLFATGVLAWSHVRPGTSLPVGMEHLILHAVPEVGEVLILESRWKRTDGRFAWFDFALTGRGGRPILEAMDYQICWLEASS